MNKEARKARKRDYFDKLDTLLSNYSKCLIVGIDNVGSNQMQKIRISLRGHAQVLMGKNTMIRKAVRGHVDKNPNVEKLLPHLKGNIGFVFTHKDLIEIKNKILDNKVKAPARPGSIAPCDVMLKPQGTALGPEKTSFFQALHIPTKISKGSIEILNEIHLIKKDEKVGASEATLLNMLNISPFTYGLKIFQIYEDGSTFSPEVLDITQEHLIDKIKAVLLNTAALSLAIDYPTKLSARFCIMHQVRNLIAIAVMEDSIDLPVANQAREYLKDPSKFAVAEAPKTEIQEEAPKEVAKVEDEEDSDEDMGFSLFD